MRRSMFAVAVAVFCMAGCGSPGIGSSGLIKYDELKDETTASALIDLGKFFGHDGGTLGNHLWVCLSGKGKRPSSWEASLHLTVNRVPKNDPPFFGERPKVGLNFYAEKEIFAHKYVPEGSQFREDSIILTGSDELTIDSLVWLAEGSSMTVNGQPIALTPEQRNQVREVVIAARRASAQ